MRLHRLHNLRAGPDHHFQVANRQQISNVHDNDVSTKHGLEEIALQLQVTDSQ
jgi:hypothetical protein